MGNKIFIDGVEVPVKDSNQVADEFHTFGELYEHRVTLMIALMSIVQGRQGFDVGWSLRHEDGELCFGGGWVIAWIDLPSGKQIRYHLSENFPLPKNLERKIATPWNGKTHETLEALRELIALFNQ